MNVKTLSDTVSVPARSNTQAASDKSQDDGAQARFGGILDTLAKPDTTSAKSDTKDTSALSRGTDDHAKTTAAFSASKASDAASADGQAPLSYATPAVPVQKTLDAAGTINADAAASQASGPPLPSLQDLLATLPTQKFDQSGSPATKSGASASRRAGDDKSGQAGTQPADAATAAPADTTFAQGVAMLSGLIGLSSQPIAATKAATTTDAKASSITAARGSPTPTVAGSVGVASPDDMETQSDALTAHLDASSSTSFSGAHASTDAKDQNDSSKATVAVTKVSVQTDLSMAPMLTPMQQVIDTVKTMAATESQSAPAASAQVTTMQPTVSSRTMTLTLEPENLGTVTVRMQLRGDSLDLQLDVANAQTLSMLSKDKDSLTTAMSGQDYNVGTLTLRASEGAAASQDNGAQSQDGQSGSQTSFSQPGESQRGASQQSAGGSGAFDGSSSGRGSRPSVPVPADEPGPVRSARSGTTSSSGVYI